MIHFSNSSHRFCDTNGSISWQSKWWSNSRSAIFEEVPFDGKYQPLYKSYLGFFSLALAVFKIFAYKNQDLENVGHVKCATMAFAVVQNDIRNDVIRWIVSTIIQIIIENSSLDITAFNIVYIYIYPEIVWICKYRSRSRFTTFAIAPFNASVSLYKGRSRSIFI